MSVLDWTSTRLLIGCDAVTVGCRDAAIITSQLSAVVIQTVQQQPHSAASRWRVGCKSIAGSTLACYTRLLRNGLPSAVL